jgi:diguanylate cyclase (GGDEF)-like protein
VVFPEIRPYSPTTARSCCGHGRGEGLVLLDEGSTRTGVGALAVAVLLLALGIVLFVRWRRAATREIAQIQATSERTEALLIELTHALENARDEGDRLAAMGEVGVTLDLDEEIERALRAVSELAGADAAMIVLGPEEGEPITASHGLTVEESRRDLLGIPQDAGRARAVRLGYLYSAEEVVNDAFRLAGGLAVPLWSGHGERVGTLAVFWRGAEWPVADHELARFDQVASAFGPALDHARLYSEARQLADTDPLTSLKNRRYFDERLRRECARARRYDRALGLLVFEAEDLTDFAFAGERIQDAVRVTDVAAHLGEGLFAVIMPEAGQPAAEKLQRRLQFALGGRVDDRDVGVRLHAGLVELRREDDAATLLRRAQDALDRAKEAAFERLTAAQGT